MSIGFVGLGVMGRPMAGHLLANGHTVNVWNRTRSRAEDFVKTQPTAIASSLRELAETCTVIMICVSRTEDVEEVVGELAAHAQQGTLIIDHSTIEPAGAKHIGEALAKSGLRFMDAPLTGGEKGALSGTLTIFCGGSEADFNDAKPLLDAYAKNARLVGPLGSGQMMKMANQISVALCVLAMSECLVFCEKAGLDLKESIELIGSGAGGSWSLTNYGPKVLERDWSPGFAVALQQKDLAYALQAAREVGVALPGTALTHQLFAALENAGRSKDATPALFEVIESLSKKATV